MAQANTIATDPSGPRRPAARVVGIAVPSFRRAQFVGFLQPPNPEPLPNGKMRSWKLFPSDRRVPIAFLDEVPPACQQAAKDGAQSGMHACPNLHSAQITQAKNAKWASVVDISRTSGSAPWLPTFPAGTIGHLLVVGSLQKWATFARNPKAKILRVLGPSGDQSVETAAHIIGTRAGGGVRWPQACLLFASAPHGYERLLCRQCSWVRFRKLRAPRVICRFASCPFVIIAEHNLVDRPFPEAALDCLPSRAGKGPKPAAAKPAAAQKKSTTGEGEKPGPVKANAITLSPEELARRRDRRAKRAFTVDSASTRDIDDAIGIERLPNGNFLVRV